MSSSTSPYYEMVYLELLVTRDGFNVRKQDSLLGLNLQDVNIKNDSIEPKLKSHLTAALECKTSDAAYKVLCAMAAEEFNPRLNFSYYDKLTDDNKSTDDTKTPKIRNVSIAKLQSLVKENMPSKTYYQQASEKCILM